MPKVSRFKKRESDRTGFDFKEIQLTKDEGFLVGPGEYDTPPPSNKSLGGEGDVSPGFTRTAYLNYSDGTVRPIYSINSSSAIPYVPNNYYTDPLFSPNDGVVYVTGSLGVIDIAVNPQIAFGTSGNKITIVCVDSGIVLQNGSGLSMVTQFEMKSGSSINFVMGTNIWYETSRVENGGI